MRHITRLLLFFTLISLSQISLAEKKIKGAYSKQPPLFPIELKEAFPESKATFEEVKSRLLKHYYSDKLTEDALYYAAIQGMLRHVSPPDNRNLAKIWSSKQYQAFAEVLQGVQTAIGVQLQSNLYDGSLTVVNVSPNSPADGKLFPYDRIMRINNESLRGKKNSEVNALLSGKPGSTISFTVVRDIHVFDVKLTRTQYSVQNINVKILDTLAYVAIKNVSENTAKELEKTFTQLAQEGVTDLVVDLRNNGGGDFFEGLRMAETLLPKESVILRILQKSQQIENYVSNNENPSKFNIIVLINQHTASSAEVFAAALRDHQLARLVGTRSLGKATVEGTYSLDNGYYAKFIIAAMYSPRGQSWHSKGLLPDYFVEADPSKLSALQKLPLHQQLSADLQLATAWNLLKERQKNAK